MEIVNLTQGSDEWLEWREGGIGASDVACLANDVRMHTQYTDMSTTVSHEIMVAGTPFKTAYQLWAEKTGRIDPPDLSNNPNVRRGNAQEDEARDEANSVFGELGVPVCAQHSEYPFIRVSFDSVFSNGDILEIKAPGDKVYQKALQYGPPAYYVWQVVDQMVVSGAENGYLYLYRRHEPSLVYRFEREHVAEMIDEIIKRQINFWYSITHDVAPALDPERDAIDLSGDPIWRDLSDQWLNISAIEQTAKQGYEEARKERQAIEKKMAAEAGHFALATGDSIRFNRFTRQGSVDYAKLVADRLGELSDADVAPYRRRSSEQVKVTRVTAQS